MERHELPNGYLDQVVDFIHKNTGGVELGAGGDSTYVDPYTGATRYTGGGVTTGTGGGQSYDPFTGGSRYTGGGVTTGPGQSSGGSDPFTGSSSYSGAPAAAPANKILPVKTYLTFKNANAKTATAINAKAAMGKLEQFNDQLSTSSVSDIHSNSQC